MNEKCIRRQTLQRAWVLDAVKALSHPTAKEIYGLIAGTENISIATVYRNLMILEEAGDIVQVTCDPEVVRYDARKDRHYHFHCRACGKVYDMPMPYRGDWDRQNHTPFAVERHLITFVGLCHRCKA